MKKLLLEKKYEVGNRCIRYFKLLVIVYCFQEPLNSEDDVTDDDPTDLFDTDNVVVCQYDKVS